VQIHQLFAGQILRPGEQFRDAVIGGGGLALFFIGEGHDAEREDFVDLATVEQIAGAFRGDLRVIGQNDRRGQERIGLVRGAGEHGPAADVLALPGQLGPLCGRIGQRNKYAALGGEDQMRRSQRMEQGRVARRGVRQRSMIRDADGQANQIRRHRRGGEFYHAGDRLLLPHQPRGRAAWVNERFDLSAFGEGERLVPRLSE
jgi:hypothetical protein